MNDYPVGKPDIKTRKGKIRWFLDEIDSYKEDMGKWYSWFIRVILPFLIFIIPVNIVCSRLYEMVVSRFFSGVMNPTDSSAKALVWLIGLLVLLVLLVFLPRIATIAEFVISGAFYYIALTVTYTFERNGEIITKPLITNGLGYFVLISLSVFMFMKFVFLIIEIIYRIVFHGEKEPVAYQDDETNIVF